MIPWFPNWYKGNLENNRTWPWSISKTQEWEILISFCYNFMLHFISSYFKHFPFPHIHSKQQVNFLFDQLVLLILWQHKRVKKVGRSWAIISLRQPVTTSEVKRKHCKSVSGIIRISKNTTKILEIRECCKIRFYQSNLSVLEEKCSHVTITHLEFLQLPSPENLKENKTLQETN